MANEIAYTDKSTYNTGVFPELLHARFADGEIVVEKQCFTLRQLIRISRVQKRPYISCLAR